MKTILSVMIALAIAAFSSPAEARGGRFGTEDKIYRIETIELTPEFAAAAPAEWRDGVTLARRASIQWFLLGAWLTDIEYVAVPTSGGDAYWSLNDEQMRALHEMGAISSSAPAYTIPTIDYMFAYSLWIAIGLVGFYLLGSAWITNMRAAGVRTTVGSDFPAFVRMALINAAKEDGDIADEELVVIADILKRAFNVDTTRLQLVEEAAAATLKSGQLVAHFQMAQRAMTAEQRGLLIQALVALFSADGRWSSAERRLLQRYVMALGADSKQASQVVSDLARQRPAAVG